MQRMCDTVQNYRVKDWAAHASAPSVDGLAAKVGEADSVRGESKQSDDSSCAPERAEAGHSKYKYKYKYQHKFKYKHKHGH